MSENEHPEDLCRRCGHCCHAKVIADDEVYYTDLPCPYLDLDTRLCTIYEKRHELNADCLTVAEGIALRVFPADCPYVKDLVDYRPPHTDCDLTEMGRLYLDED